MKRTPYVPYGAFRVNSVLLDWLLLVLIHKKGLQSFMLAPFDRRTH